MPQIQRWFLGGLLLCLLGANCWLLFGQDNGSCCLIEASRNSRSGPQSPPIADVLSGHRTLGQTVELRSLVPVGSSHQFAESGQPVVIMFLRHDCACGEELSHVLEQIAVVLEGKATVCAVVDEPDPGNAVVSVLPNISKRISVLCDPTHAVAQELGISRAGFTVLADKSGVVSHFWPGVSFPMIRELASAIDPLLAPDLTTRLPNLTGSPRAGCPIVVRSLGEVR